MRDPAMGLSPCPPLHHASFDDNPLQTKPSKQLISSGSRPSGASIAGQHIHHGVIFLGMAQVIDQFLNLLGRFSGQLAHHIGQDEVGGQAKDAGTQVGDAQYVEVGVQVVIIHVEDTDRHTADDAGNGAGAIGPLPEDPQ